MKASIAKFVLEDYDDDDEVAFVVYDRQDVGIILGRPLTVNEAEKILTYVQEKITSVISEDFIRALRLYAYNERKKGDEDV